VIREKKAIEIANALLEEGYDEGRAIRITIVKAKGWVGGTRGPHGDGDRAGTCWPVGYHT
jgi:hypothetical protein